MRDNRKLLALATSFFGIAVVIGAVAVFGQSTSISQIVTLLMLGALGVLLSATLLFVRTISRRLTRKVTSPLHRSDRRTLKGSLTRTASGYSDFLLEELNRAEFRIISAFKEANNDIFMKRLSEYASEQTQTLLRELSALRQLEYELVPSIPISAGSPFPTIVRSLTTSLLRNGPKRILALHLGEQALWFAYAARDVEMTIICPPNSSVDLRKLVRVHGLEQRVKVLEVPSHDLSVPHHYDPWFDFPALGQTFDTFVFGSCDYTSYPAPLVLAPFADPSSSLVLPINHDREVSNAWQTAGWLEPTADPLVFQFGPNSIGRGEAVPDALGN